MLIVNDVISQLSAIKNQGYQVLTITTILFRHTSHSYML